MAKDTITAVYTVKNSNQDIQKLAKSIALGQTVGAWEDLPGDLKTKCEGNLAVVNSIDEGEYSSLIKIDFPIKNFSDDLGALLTAVYGKISLVPDIKLEDIEFSDSYLEQFSGPTLGISGIRKILNKDQSPLLMSIFKPCLGLTSNDLGEMFYTQANAGIDLVKDDEILYDKDFNDTLSRLEACLNAKHKANSKTIYSISLTGKANEILHRAKELEKNGAECLLFNYISYGIPMLHALRETVSIPIMAHPAFAGALCGKAYSGLSEMLLLGKLPRIAGADLVLFPSPYGSLAWDKDITLSIHQALNTDLKINKTFSVPSAGIKPSMLKEIINDFGNDIVINAGTAVWSHAEGGYSGACEFINQLKTIELVKN